MLAADRDVLYSQFTRNSLQVHTKLVHLYLANLNAIATQAAIVADLGFGGIKEVELPESHIEGSFLFGYIYYISCMCALMASLLALSQSTILVIYGHSLFIKGESSSDSIDAVAKLRSSQLESGFWGAVCTFFLLVQGCSYTWAVVSNYRVGIVMCTVYIAAFYYIYTHGSRTIHSFLIMKERQETLALTRTPVENPVTAISDSTTEGDSEEAPHSPPRKAFAKQITWMRQIGSSSPSLSERQQLEEQRFSQYENIRKKIRNGCYRGVLWARFHEAFNTRCFVKCYAVLERGRLDFYRSKQHFVDICDTVNKKPFRLKQYSLELDPRLIDHFTPPNSLLGYTVMRAAMTGVTDVGIKDFYAADFDVLYATKELRMTLLPMTSTEISLDEPLHMMAEDKEMFKYWTDAFSEVIGYYEELNELNYEESHKKRIENVEDAVNSAHNRYAAADVVIDVEPGGTTAPNKRDLKNPIPSRRPNSIIK